MTAKISQFYLQLNPNALENVRKEFNLHRLGEMDQCIDILNDWIKKQDHFVKKDLPREYLESTIISAKGSVEVAKKRIDRLFTLQTMSPNLFLKCHATIDFPNLRNFFLMITMPYPFEDNSRLNVGKLMTKSITPSDCLATYQHLRIILEYIKLHDYCIGYHAIYDLGDVNISYLISNIDWIDLRSAIDMLIEVYGFRVMSFYLISPSKMINALVTLVKQIVSEKIGKRIHVVKKYEDLHRVMPKQFLPKDFGGEQKSILDLYDEMNEFLTSAHHLAHMEEMKNARTIEELRSSDNFNTEYLGMSGSFKMLNVD
ncbi:uncharacterized protein LOC134674873 [Cydia fagiglandana]|uniref:uncharacterized protein LOC134674873 n=1 Tax=Cydia fagiglandana TaxID=1458189 RepID=UPI002FEE5B06